ncbi:MAG: peptide ABC transporter substrate-binding protein [Pseudomonadales bacterium]
MRILLLLLFVSALACADEAVDFESRAITIALTQEPPNLDTTRTTDLVSFFVIGHVNEGLIRYDRRGNLVPGVASSWEVDERRIIFKLRPDARWSDGSRVTAHDFVYAWRLLNDPGYGAPYAGIMYPIRNAERVQSGAAGLTELGVRARSDDTLEVELESPCGYCLGLMVHAAFYPVSERFHKAQADTYGAEVDKLLYNGPFKLVEWVHGSRMRLIKNPDYWNRDAINLNEIRVGYITEDNRTRLNLFRDNRIALARLGAETVVDAAAQGMRLRTFLSGGMSYLSFNTANDRLLHDSRIRRAIQLVFDPDQFVNKVIAIPGYRPAYSFFPSWLQGVDGKFVDEFPLEPVPVDLVEARRLIAEVADELGLDRLPSINLLTVTSPTGTKIAEYFQGLLQQQLGLDVRVDQQIFKLYIDKARNGSFDIALSSWYPDFDDVVTFADLLASWNPNNRGGYKSADYDQALHTLMRSVDPLERMRAADRLQIIIRRDVPVLPMAETGSAYLQHPKLRGVIRRALGADPDYTFAEVLP